MWRQRASFFSFIQSLEPSVKAGKEVLQCMRSKHNRPHLSMTSCLLTCTRTLSLRVVELDLFGRCIPRSEQRQERDCWGAGVQYSLSTVAAKEPCSLAWKLYCWISMFIISTRRQGCSNTSLFAKGSMALVLGPDQGRQFKIRQPS